jgi:hypothetical protein
MRPKQVHIFIDGLRGSNTDAISKKLHRYSKDVFTKYYKSPILVQEPFLKELKTEVKEYYNKMSNNGIEHWQYLYDSAYTRSREYDKLRRKINQIYIHNGSWITDLIYSSTNYPKWDKTYRNILHNSIYIMVKPNQTIIMNNLKGKSKRFDKLTAENYHKYVDRQKYIYLNLVQRGLIRDYKILSDSAPHTNVKQVLDDIRSSLN